MRSKIQFLHLCVFSQIEREVTEAMMKSLKYCDLQTESARQPLYQYRAATIHHRLASMYHSCFRNQVGNHVKVYYNLNAHAVISAGLQYCIFKMYFSFICKSIYFFVCLRLPFFVEDKIKMSDFL